MSIIQTSSPFLRSFTHIDATVGTSTSTVLDKPAVGEKRILVVIQNRSTTANIFVVLNDTGTSGILVQPLQLISLDNWNGVVRVNADAGSTPIHIAYSQV